MRVNDPGVPPTADGAAEAVVTYYQCFDRDDWGAIASMFDLPALVLSGPRKRLLESRARVLEYYRRRREAFRREGAVGLRWADDDMTVVPIHDGLAWVRVVLTRVDAGGKATRTWVCSYTLRRQQAVWRICVMTGEGGERPS